MKGDKPVVRQSLAADTDTAKFRSNIYNFLSLLYAREPSQELIDEILKPDFVDILSGIGVEFNDEIIKAPREKLTEDLIVEYTRLFLGPGPHISPHESVYVGGYRDRDPKIGLLWGNATAEVKDMAENLGFTYREDYHGIPDHLAVELELMGSLAAREYDMLINGNAEEAYKCLLQEKRFLTEHLSRWIGVFCGQVIENARHVFYREMAHLTRDYVLQDVEMVDRKISEFEGELHA